MYLNAVKEDRTTATGNVYGKYGEIWTWFSRYASVKTNRQTNKQTDIQTRRGAK